MSIQDTVKQLSAQLEATQEFKDLRESFLKLKGNEEEYKFFLEVNDFQNELKTKQFNGQDISDDDIKKLNGYGEKMNSYADIVDLMNKERVVHNMFVVINQELSAPLDELYKDLNTKDTTEL